ncbi:uncharacterized protein LOC144577183 [Callithrix jacchus]
MTLNSTSRSTEEGRGVCTEGGEDAGDKVTNAAADREQLPSSPARLGVGEPPPRSWAGWEGEAEGALHCLPAVKNVGGTIHQALSRGLGPLIPRVCKCRSYRLVPLSTLTPTTRSPFSGSKPILGRCHSALGRGARACRSRDARGGGRRAPPSRPWLIPLLQRRFPGPVLFKTENIQPQSLPWGGEGKEVEWEEVDPGRKKREIRPRETAPRGRGARRFCHLAFAGAGAGPRPGPARRGESPAAAAPPHALPRRPRARGRPGQVAAVPGSGRPGAAASERGGGGGGGGGQRGIVLLRGPTRAGRAGRAVLEPASPVRIHSSRFLWISLGADTRAFTTHSDFSRTQE